MDLISKQNATAAVWEHLQGLKFAAGIAHIMIDSRKSKFYNACLQYKTDQAQDVKKIEKLYGKLMRLMVSKETHSGAMEMD